MIRVDKILEYRLVIPGKPESFRSRKASRYKKRVRQIARSIFKRPLDRGEINVILDYFHTSQRRFDMDNISKCVLDALNGIAYKDDKSVRWQTSVSHFLGEPLFIQGGPVDLVKPLKEYDSYVFIRLRIHPRLFAVSDTRRRRAISN
jgi:Holliday junction resolvase RusA-like endonuclease